MQSRMHSDSEDSAGLTPLGAVAQPEFDTELAAMLVRAAESIGLEWNPLPCPELLQLDNWYLGLECILPGRA